MIWPLSQEFVLLEKRLNNSITDNRCTGPRCLWEMMLHRTPKCHLRFLFRGVLKLLWSHTTVILGSNTVQPLINVENQLFNKITSLLCMPMCREWHQRLCNTGGPGGLLWGALQYGMHVTRPYTDNPSQPNKTDRWGGSSNPYQLSGNHKEQVREPE